jgi:hypothetical protein
MAQFTMLGCTRHPRAIGFIAAVPIALLLGALLIGGQVSVLFSAGPASAGAGSSMGIAVIGMYHPAAGSESTTCAMLNSNASLNGTYDGVYSQLPNESGTAGPNSTQPLGQSGYPNETTGDRELITAWVSICDSPAFTALYEEWGPSSLEGGAELQGNGHYTTFYDFVYHASCSNPSVKGDGGCEYFTTWYVDLVTGNVTGPITTQGGTPLGAPGGQSPPWTISNLPTSGVYALLGGIAAAAALGMLGTVLLGRRRGATPHPPAPSSKPSAGESTTPPSELRQDSLPPSPSPQEAASATGVAEGANLSQRPFRGPAEQGDSPDTLSDVY